MEVVDGGLKEKVSQLFEVLVSPAAPKSKRGPALTAGVGSGSGASSGGGGIGGTGNGAVVASGSGGSGGGGGNGGGSGGDEVSGVVGGSKGGGGGVGVGKYVPGDGSGGGGGGGGGGSPEPLVLDYGDVYEGKLYQRRSFVIVNKAPMPLEFQLSSSLPASELNFSLSAVTLKQFKSVHVEANTRLQVK